jgi:hypothetical protein
MKQLDFDAVLMFSAVLDKTGIVLDMKKIMDGVKTDAVETEDDLKKIGKEAALTVGIEILGQVLRSAHKAGPEIKALVGHLTGKTRDEVGQMTLAEIKEFFKELFAAEGFSDFFKQAAGWSV